MDQKTLSHILDTLGAQHMPDDLDLLPEIQARLMQKRPFRPTLQQPARLMAGLLIGLLIVATTVYAAQYFIRDPGLQEDMVTPLNLSQTRGDVTITLDWAYADANRIKLAYTVSSLTQEIVENWVTDVTLTDQQAPRERQTFMGYAKLVDIQRTSAYVYQAEAHFEVDRIKNPAQILELRLRIMGNYRFDFSVPFNPGLWIEKQPDVEVADLKANVEWAIITPSMTRAYICYETPDNTLWIADIGLSYDEQSVAHEPGARWAIPGPNNGPGERWCSKVSFLTSYETRPNDLTFTITSIQTPTVYTEDDMRHAAEVFETYGVKAEALPSTSEPNSGYTLNWLSPVPDPEEFYKIWEEAVATMDDNVRWRRIEGPWDLTVHLP